MSARSTTTTSTTTTTSDSALRPIPQPPPRLLLGNLTDIDKEDAIGSISQMIRRYGEIVKLQVPNGPKNGKLFIGSQRLVHEVSDQERFEKVVSGALEQVRSLAGDGLFTAYSKEESWAIAHRILIPAFGPLSIRNMFDGMVDIATQLVEKWTRFGDARIDVAADFTRLTLDTIALCTFSHRFNSFYTEAEPPFVHAMASSLHEAGVRNRRLPGTGWMFGKANQRYKDDIALQHRVADELIRERIEGKDNAPDDLLSTMLNGKDPKTGQGLSPENIRYQLVTFLIAGHETTSGMLSFLFHYLLKTPRAYQAIRDEVDRVCGSESVRYEHLQKFKYIDAALKETLRLKSTAPAWTVAPRQDEVIGGCYKVDKGQSIIVVLDALHRDPKVWGDDVEDFRPERMLDGRFEALPPDAWKPFGNGMRGCIGRPFAWQESLLVVGMLFQRFDMRPDDQSYQLAIKTSLTIKPKGFYMHVKQRKDRLVTSISSAASVPRQGQEHSDNGNLATEVNLKGPKLAIYYGSNAGTCKALAYKLKGEAVRRGMNVEIDQLNSVASGDLPRDRPVAIVTASYEGQPTDDANFFVEWLKNAKADSQKGVQYAVFGCGHPDWAATFHAIPKLIDDRLADCGAERLCDRGEGNAAVAELFDQFDDWEAGFLERAGGQTGGSDKPGLTADIDSEIRKNLLQQQSLLSCKVISNEVISKGDVDIKRKIVLELPEGVEYRTGDYIGLLPSNPIPVIQRVLVRFGLHADDVVTLRGTAGAWTLPLDMPISAFDLLAAFVELESPVTLKQVEKLKTYAAEESQELARLEEYCKPDVFKAEIGDKRVDLLSLVEELERLDMPFSDFLIAMPSIKMRQYSISSSPLDDPRRAALTIAVIDAPHVSGRGVRYYGTATHFLASLVPGSLIRAGVKPSGEQFHPPTDPSVDILMAASGSGIAPFRGFVQERALQKAAGRQVGKAMLFYGCRSPDTDLLYDDEMREWERQGVVEVFHAFSRSSEGSEGCRYVQDRVYHERKGLAEMFKNGAKVYLCGSGRMASGVKETCAQIYADHKEVAIEEGREWLKAVQAERFATDIFG